MFDRGVVHIVVAAYIVDHYFLCLTEEWFILLLLAILFPITISGLTDECPKLLWLVILLTINV